MGPGVQSSDYFFVLKQRREKKTLHVPVPTRGLGREKKREVGGVVAVEDSLEWACSRLQPLVLRPGRKS